jgi:hypothetical protein
MEPTHTEKVFVKKRTEKFVRFSLFLISYLDVKKGVLTVLPICLIAKSMNNSANLKQQSPK